MVDSHFQNRDFIFFGQPENGQRKTDLIIIISFCFQYVIFLRQNRGNQLFGAGLADASRNADHFQIQPAAVIAGQIFERLFGGLYNNIRVRDVSQGMFG